MNIINAITFDISKVDGNAVTIFLIGFGVVFFALLIIYLIFAYLPKLLNIKIKKKSDASPKTEVLTTQTSSSTDSEIFAAIAMALSLHFEDHHDEESMILTLDINDRINSPWNTKIQNVISKH